MSPLADITVGTEKPCLHGELPPGQKFKELPLQTRREGRDLPSRELALSAASPGDFPTRRTRWAADAQVGAGSGGGPARRHTPEQRPPTRPHAGAEVALRAAPLALGVDWVGGGLGCVWERERGEGLKRRNVGGRLRLSGLIFHQIKRRQIVVHVIIFRQTRGGRGGRVWCGGGDKKRGEAGRPLTAGGRPAPHLHAPRPAPAPRRARLRVS